MDVRPDCPGSSRCQFIPVHPFSYQFILGSFKFNPDHLDSTWIISIQPGSSRFNLFVVCKVRHVTWTSLNLKAYVKFGIVMRMTHQKSLSEHFRIHIDSFRFNLDHLGSTWIISVQPGSSWLCRLDENSQKLSGKVASWLLKIIRVCWSRKSRLPIFFSPCFDPLLCIWNWPRWSRLNQNDPCWTAETIHVDLKKVQVEPKWSTL